MAQLGSTAGNLGQQQASLLGQLGSTAGTLTAQEGQIKNTAANNLGTLGQTGQNISLADINALATLGGQQQTIAQNKELFPLSNLSTLSGILRGYNIPTSTKTTAEMSPLSGLATIGAGTAGLFQGTGTSGTGPSLVKQFTDWYNKNNAADQSAVDTSGNYNGTVSNVDLSGNPIVPGSIQDPNSYGEG